MARKLPPFASVRAFEAAARHCSFKMASEELGITPSAVSHQVKSLEDYLGQPLFYRTHSNLVLTDAGKQYLPKLTKVLDQLDIATHAVMSPEDKTDITISLTQSLASNWLVARIPAFRLAHPEINLRLITKDTPQELAGQDIDFSIRYLNIDDVEAQIKSAYQAKMLFRETITPVCNRDYAQRLGDDVGTADIIRHPLIYCDTEPDEWQQWSENFNVPYTETPRRINLDTRMLALKAAQDGLGIAMGRTPFYEDDLARGDLITPISDTMSTGCGYYLVYAKRKSRERSIRKFKDWIMSVCNDHNNTGP